MCWSMGVTAAMVGLGAVATALSARRGDAVAIPATLGYFTAMEALQLAGYAVVDQCGNPANESVTFLSVLHIIFQPFLINAFAMQLVPAPVRTLRDVLQDTVPVPVSPVEEELLLPSTVTYAMHTH